MSLQEKLHRLHVLDRQVKGLRTRLDAATRRLDAQRNKHDQLQRQQQELAGQLRLAQATAASRELELKQMEERIDKHRAQMNNVTSNKEYSALLVEINTIKIDKSRLEDETPEQLSKVDLLKSELQQKGTSVTDQERIVVAAQSEVDQCRAEVGDKLEALVAQRDEAARDIPPTILPTFERLAQSSDDGGAMAEVIEENRRTMEYTCGGCYMSIPAENVNSLITRPDALICCPSCNRILYVDQNLKASMGSK